MQFAFFFVLSLIVAAIHLLRDKRPRTASHVAEVLLLWQLVIRLFAINLGAGEGGGATRRAEMIG